MNPGGPVPADPSLNLPRILCLHGGGTNARIFRAQCRVLEKALQPNFRLCFAEAPFPSQPGPDVNLVYADCGPSRAWLRWNADDPERDAKVTISAIEASLISAMAADDNNGATGEWVGLLGFSQGAKICASLLLSQQLREENHGLPSRLGQKFRFAVLLAGRSPLVSLGPEVDIVPGVVDASAISGVDNPIEDNYTITEYLLRVPTIHVHGLKDPGLDLHRKLLHHYCDKRYTRLVEWDGVHRVPIKTVEVAAIVEAILQVATETRALPLGRFHAYRASPCATFLVITIFIECEPVIMQDLNQHQGFGDLWRYVFAFGLGLTNDIDSFYASLLAVHKKALDKVSHQERQTTDLPSITF